MQIKRIYISSLLLLLVSVCSHARIGSGVFAFMHVPASARIGMLGSHNVSIDEGELSFALQNPALLSEKTHMQLQLNYTYYIQSIHLASAMYSHNYKRNYFAAAIHYMDYGKMDRTTETGQQIGSFSARDMYIDIIYARQLSELFRIGVALKPVYSNYAGYSSFALGADVGGHFQTRDKSFQLGLSLQNIGWQLKGFYSDENGQKRERLPLNLVLGLNYRFKHAPIRLSFTMHDLQSWKAPGVKWYDNLFRHTVFALDIVPKSDKFYLTLSYNHQIRAEMHLKDQRSLAGFALGAGLNLKQFRMAFAFSQYTKGAYLFQASLSLNINQLMK